MKYSKILSIFMLFAYGCNHHEMSTKLLKEQKILKDSANIITKRIGDYLHNESPDGAEANKKQLATVYARLIAIQYSIDSLEKMK